MVVRAVLFCLSLVALPALASDKLIQYIEYIGADYSAAVVDGNIVSAAEYGEMQEFSSLIAEEVATAPQALQQQSAQLKQLIAQKAAEKDIQALTALMRQSVISAMPSIPVPQKSPDLKRGEALFTTNCASCHGATAMGDGIAGAQMDPAPTNFHDVERYQARSVYGLFNTITLGVADTGMASFAHLDEQSRWDLAFYVGHIAGKDLDTSKVPAGMIEQDAVKDLLTATPKDVIKLYPDFGAELMGLFRSRPELFFQAQSKDPLVIAQQKLQLSEDLYQQNPQAAYDQAVSAYLEGFELVEGSLNTVNPALRNQIEQAMLGLRQLLKDPAQKDEVAPRIAEVQNLLKQAQTELSETQLSGINVFLAALLILLREGLEALLVVAAIYSVAVKTDKPALRHTVHIGWIGSLLLGGVTWFVASFMIDISGASRELTEGYTALIAAAILFYMGFWMHSKTSAKEWSNFIQHKVRNAVSGGAYLGLGLVVFLAVYREAFETILFYQALWLQGGEQAQQSFIAGIASALLLLAILGVSVFKFALKLPLKTFFGSTALLMLVLAIVMAGKGIAALQEAGTLSVSQLNLPTISWLGFYPNTQGVIVQSLLVLIALVYLVRSRKG